METADTQPAITELVRKTLRDAAQGKVNADAIAPESRDRLVAFLERDGPPFLGRARPLRIFDERCGARDTPERCISQNIAHRMRP